MKRLLVGIVSSLVSIGFMAMSATAVVAVNPHTNQEIPEVTGTYNDPGHKGVKVRVEVYRAQGDKKPAPGGGAPSLVCNLADPESSAVAPRGGWKLPANVTYRLNPGSVPATVNGANLATIASNSFTDWQMASGGKVTFARGADTTVARQANDGQNVLAWNRLSSSDTLAVTYTRYNSNTGVVVDADTIFNKSIVWYWSNQPNCAYNNVFDVENIMNHEIGHWMGLGDTYETAYQHNTMYGYGLLTEVKKNTLTSGDIAAVTQIYY